MNVCCPRHHVAPDGPCGPLAPDQIAVLHAVAYEAVDHLADGAARRLGAGASNFFLLMPPLALLLRARVEGHQS